jgi:hypothetical protein
MAETTRSPSLPSTADTTPYVPVSWAAAAAVTVAGAFLLTLLAFGYFAFSNKKPLLMEELLVMPVIAIVLSFAARRMIRNSEGTRTGTLYGVDLVNTAWWMALIIGLCYIAYLFAIDYAIRRDARGEAEKWMGHVTKGTDDDIFLAFHRTLPPGMRQSVASNDTHKMQLQFRDDLLMFRNSDLLRLARRNEGSFEFVPSAVTKVINPTSIDATVTGTVKCPEGMFPITITLKGAEGVTAAEGGGGGRQWSINRPQGGGFIDQTKATRTPYGWLLVIMEVLPQGGAAFGANFVKHVATTGPTNHVYNYRAFVAPGGDGQGWEAVAADPTGLSQFAFAVPTQAMGDAGYADYMANHFYKGRNGVEPTPEQKARFFTSWNTFGIRPAGDKLKDSGGGPIDKETDITLTETAVQMRVPIEIPLLGTSGKHEVARGRVVVECADPKLVAELKQLKAEANPAAGTSSPTEEMMRRKFAWRVVRIESDMAPVNIIPPGGPGAPGGPGGMPPSPGH